MFCSNDEYIAIQEIASQLEEAEQNNSRYTSLLDATSLVVQSDSSDYGTIMQELEEQFICIDNGITPNAVRLVLDYYHQDSWKDLKDCDIYRDQVPNLLTLMDDIMIYNDEIIQEIILQAEFPATCDQCKKKYWCYIDGDFNNPCQDDGGPRDTTREECYEDICSRMYDFYSYRACFSCHNHELILSITSALQYALWVDRDYIEYFFKSSMICDYTEDKITILNDAQLVLIPEFADVGVFEPEYRLSETGFMMLGR